MRWFTSLKSNFKMKKVFLLICLVCISFFGFSQANVTSSGISIQGIARDNDNTTPLANTSLSISISIFYLSNNTPVSILSRSANVNTDGFGVFSYVIDISKTEFTKIANLPAWIKVTSNGNTYVQEKIKAVPYVLHAQNGVPTGSILPFSGGTVPAGYLLADGSAIPNDDYHAELRKIFGSSLPDLRGVFLRGTGTSPAGTQYAGPTIRTIQADGLKTHNHAYTYTAGTDVQGSHQHGVAYSRWGSTTLPVAFSGDQIEESSGGVANSDDMWIGTYFSFEGAHTHTYSITGQNTNSVGVTETRPVNYGINYIIKI
jgi:hypothetical protein